jgi:hypothetical protein
MTAFKRFPWGVVRVGRSHAARDDCYVDDPDQSRGALVFVADTNPCFVSPWSEAQRIWPSMDDMHRPRSLHDWFGIRFG